MAIRKLRAAVRIALVYCAADSLAYSQDLSFLQPLPNPVSLETATSITAGGAAIYVSGITRPASGNAYGFNSDGFLRKFDFNGAQVWERTFGGPVTTSAVTASNGAIYVSGFTGWNVASQIYYVLPGQEGRGLSDVFLRKYDSAGNEVWTRQFGSESRDLARSVAADSTGVYVSGTLRSLNGPGDSFLTKFDLNGNQLWTQTLSFPASVAADGSGVYVAGSIPPGGDRKQWAGFVGRYDTAGSAVWTQEFEFEAFLGEITAGGGGVYVSGNRVGSSGNSFLRKFDSTGKTLWTRDLTTQSRIALALDSARVYVTGTVSAVLPGQCAAGAEDAFVKAFDFEGAELWTRQFGSYYGETANEVAVDSGAVYVVGTQSSAEYYPSIQRTFLAKLVSETPDANSSPRIQGECVLNAANYIGGAVAPGEIVTILGSNLGPASAVSFAADKETRISSLLAGTRVLFNGVSAPVISTAASRVTAIVPMAAAGQSSVDIQVEYNGIRSKVVALPVLASRPGVFSQDGSGTGPAAAINQDGTLNSPSNPAARGSIVAVYATGLGATEANLPDGQILSGIVPKVKAPVSVVFTFDGDVENGIGAGGVYYAGGVDGFVQGFTQINIQIPKVDYFLRGPLAPQVFLGEAWTSPIASQNAAVIWIQ